MRTIQRFFLAAATPKAPAIMSYTIHRYTFRINNLSIAACLNARHAIAINIIKDINQEQNGISSLAYNY